MDRATAQAIIDQHLISDETGRCTQCHVQGPCELRRNAAEELSAAKVLPRRRAIIRRAV